LRPPNLPDTYPLPSLPRIVIPFYLENSSAVPSSMGPPPNRLLLFLSTPFHHPFHRPHFPRSHKEANGRLRSYRSSFCPPPPLLLFCSWLVSLNFSQRTALQGQPFPVSYRLPDPLLSLLVRLVKSPVFLVSIFSNASRPIFLTLPPLPPQFTRQSLFFFGIPPPIVNFPLGPRTTFSSQHRVGLCAPYSFYRQPFDPLLSVPQSFSIGHTNGIPSVCCFVHSVPATDTPP